MNFSLATDESKNFMGDDGCDELPQIVRAALECTGYGRWGRANSRIGVVSGVAVSHNTKRND